MLIGLLYLAVIAAVLWGIWWLAGYFGVPQPVRVILAVVLIVLLVLAAVRLLHIPTF